MDGVPISLMTGGAALMAYGLFGVRLTDRTDLDDTMRADRRYHRQAGPYFVGAGLALLICGVVLFVVSQ